MTSTPVILLIDSHASDRTLSWVLLQRHLPQARINQVHSALTLIDELTANSPDVALVAADFQGAEVSDLVATIRKRSPRAAIILFGHESDLTARVLQPGLACEGVVSKSSAGFLALGEIVTSVLVRAGTMRAPLAAEPDEVGRSSDRSPEGEPPRVMPVAPGAPETEERDSLGEVREIALLFSHDLREPVQQLVRLAQQSQNAGERKSDDWILSHVVERAERLSTMLDGITQYLDVAGRKAKPAFIDLNVCLEKAIENLSPSIAEAQAEIRVVNSRLRSIGDEQQIIHLFQNLVSNAIKFRNAERPVITISADRCGDRWLMRFQDNGIGMPEASTERIFQLGTRLHTGKEYPGEGIGLALCRRIVERHGGRIWVESRPGEGSTFLVLLPNVEKGVTNP
jgi:signal transduction histidine kinase